jgi:hypothetical protein
MILHMSVIYGLTYLFVYRGSFWIALHFCTTTGLDVSFSSCMTPFELDAAFRYFQKESALDSTFLIAI